MASDSSSICSQATSSSSTASGKDGGGDWKCGRERMVRIEMEAAEALAGLAHWAVRESVAPLCEEVERPSQRVKGEWLRVNSGMSLDSSAPRFGDPGEDLRNIFLRARTKELVVQQQCDKTNSDIVEMVKGKKDTEPTQPSAFCTTKFVSFSGCKARKNLREAEKEARRLRRVLANRESARQTLRRRQALFEELTRKAASLTWENENLQKEKKLAAQEYDNLKSTNESLKAKMARTVKAEAGESQIESGSHAEISPSSSTNCPYYLYTQPPILWPPIIPSSYPVPLRQGSQNAIPFSSNSQMPALVRPHSFHDQENIKTSGPGVPLYAYPCPWFFPLHDHGNGLQPQPSIGLNGTPTATSFNNRCSASSSTNVAPRVEKNHQSLLVQLKRETSNTKKEVPVNNLHNTPLGFPPDRGSRHMGSSAGGPDLMPTPVTSVKASTVKHKTGGLPEQALNISVAASTTDPIADALLEKKQDSVIHRSKKQIDAAAAAEARKRRKELIKLKSLHYCPFQMHC